MTLFGSTTNRNLLKFSKGKVTNSKPQNKPFFFTKTFPCFLIKWLLVGNIYYYRMVVNYTIILSTFLWPFAMTFVIVKTLSYNIFFGHQKNGPHIVVLILNQKKRTVFFREQTLYFGKQFGSIAKYVQSSCTYKAFLY